MVQKRSALGRGLGALISESETTSEKARNAGYKEIVESPGVMEISLSNIEANPFQPRTNFDQEALEDLVDSIKSIGIVQPITVREKEGGGYQIIAGERRFRAAQILELKDIPAYVRKANDQDMLEMALVENIQRQDLDAIEVSLSYQRLMDECKLTQEQLSERVGKKRSTVTNYLRLLKLPAEVQLGIRKHLLSMGHARAMIGVEDIQKQLEIFARIIKDGLSVRQTEEIVRNIDAPVVKNKKVNVSIPSDIREISDALVGRLKSKIEFKHSEKGNGKMIISYKSQEHLEEILNLFN